MLKSLGIWASCRLKKRSHSPEGKGDSQRKQTLGRWREGASSTLHWTLAGREEASGAGGTLGTSPFHGGVGGVFSMKSGLQGGGGVRGLKRAEKSACFPENLSVCGEQGPLQGRHVGRG